jgi:hypothetical protein
MTTTAPRLLPRVRPHPAPSPRTLRAIVCVFRDRDGSLRTERLTDPPRRFIRLEPAPRGTGLVKRTCELTKMGEDLWRFVEVEPAPYHFPRAEGFTSAHLTH